MSKDCPLAQGGAVPAAIAELVLTLADAQLGTFADDDDGIGATLAEGSLMRGQSGNFVADDVSTQSYHSGERPGGREGQGGTKWTFKTKTNAVSFWMKCSWPSIN